MKKILTVISVIILTSAIIVVCFWATNNYILKADIKKTYNKLDDKSTPPTITNITISAVGDCTFANDSKINDGFNYFDSYLKNDNYGYFFSKVSEILENDDITIANLEGTFTDSQERADKTFNFKSPKTYVNILTEGSIEIVNVANNHTYDFKEKGYRDTVSTLDEANIPYFGYTTYNIQEVKGIKIGFAGLNYYDEKYNNYQEEVTKALNYLQEQKVDLILFTFHWGIEATYEQTAKQVEVGHYAIDNGADLVLGHHPHRIQGIELYKDKYIIYSLSNFVFGGHRNPSDKDSFIYQQIFTFENSELKNNKVNIVPVRISGKDNLNNYQPVIVEGEIKDKIIEKINQNSVNFRWTDESNNY